MLQYRPFKEIVDHPGLRIVLVQGTPSPWGQAAKTIFEIKGLDYVAAPWLPGEPNADFRIDGPQVHGLPGLVNLFGIESPGLTASLAIADHVAQLLA